MKVKQAKREMPKSKANVVKLENSNAWIKMLGETNYQRLREMNNSNVSIIEWEKQRCLTSCMFPVLGLLLYLFLDKQWYYLAGGFAVGIIFYLMKARGIKQAYSQFKFERQLQFSKFTRLLIPYLKQSNGASNLYSIFGKIVGRLDYETDRNLLMKLMQDMTDKPGDIQPFIEYAEQTSNTDMSVLFMSTLFDIYQGVSDLSVVEELDKLASAELMEGINTIIDYKTKKFTFFPTKITMTSFILVIGFAASMLISNLKDLHFF